jgi:glycosyltransferase involved in cell wall biosynthesis
VIVVFLTHNYPRAAGDLPGSFLHPLALALKQRGHDVRVVAPSDQGRGGREPLDGIPVRRVRYGSPMRETLAYTGRMQEAIRSPGGLLALRSLVRALRAGARAELAAPPSRPSAEPAVVHAHWWFPAGLAAPSGYPSLVTLHGTDGRILVRNTITRAFGRRVLRRARVVTAVSPELAELVERVTGRERVAAHVQAMPVDTTGWAWSGGGGGLIVVARLTRQKRVDLAIRGASTLADTGTPLPLTIIGDGPERGNLERLAARHSSSPVRFLGALPHAEVLRQLERADAMLFPAEQEGFGLAAIEALMLGVPVVVCSDGGGVVSAVSRYGGGLVSSSVRWELAGAIREALTDRSRRAARSAGARWREDLSPERVAERFEAWYGEALAR